MSELDKAVEQLHNEGYSSEDIKTALDKIKEETRKQPVMTGKFLSADELQGYFDNEDDTGEFTLNLSAAREDRADEILNNKYTKGELQMNELNQYKIKYNLPGVRGIFYKPIEAANKTEARKIFKNEVPKAIYIVIDEIKEEN